MDAALCCSKFFQHLSGDIYITQCNAFENLKTKKLECKNHLEENPF